MDFNVRLDKFNEKRDIFYCKFCIENKIKIFVGYILNFLIFGFRINLLIFFYNGYIVIGFKIVEMGFIVCFNKIM